MRRILNDTTQKMRCICENTPQSVSGPRNAANLAAIVGFVHSFRYCQLACHVAGRQLGLQRLNFGIHFGGFGLLQGIGHLGPQCLFDLS